MTSIDAPPTLRRRNGRRPVIGLALAIAAPALAAGATAVGVELATAPAAQAAPANCVDSGLATTCTFSSTGAPQDWTVPAGVTKATFTVIGAAGGNAGAVPGGAGGGVISTLDVAPGTGYRLYVGGKGASDTDPDAGRGGWNGGGTGPGTPIRFGAGGGGASDVRVSPYGLPDRILVGGGGGGAGSPVLGSGPKGIPGAGGSGGGGDRYINGFMGGNVSGAWVGAGGGGAATSIGPGGGGGPSGGVLYQGCDSITSAVGTRGGAGTGNARGGAGGYLRSSGSETPCLLYAGWGGGGGGGWFAGGGGGGGITGGGGGGGGSAYAPPGSNNTPYGARTAGRITIAYVRASEDWVGVGGSPMTSAPTVVATIDSGKLAPRHDVFYLNQHSAVIWRTVIEGVPGPETNLGATLYPGSTVAAVWRPYGLDLFGRGTESALWRKSYVQGRWGAWTALTAPGALTSDPAVASPSHDRLDVFFRGADNRLKQLSNIDEVWANAPTTVPGGPAISSGPGATSTTRGNIELLAGCAEGLCWWSSVNGVWHYKYALPGASVSSAPALATLREDWIEGAVRNQAGGITRWEYAGGGDWFPTTLSVPSDPGQAVALVPGPRTEFFYARGSDNELKVRTLSW